MVKKSTDILKQSGLSITAGRKSILDVFIASGNALAHQDIETVCSEQFDRVTIYRTLQTFLEKGIIHSIPATDNITRYALCSEICTSSGHHHDNHIHFRCEKCSKTLCLDEISIPAVKLPEGYTLHEINMVVNGICKTCQ